MKSFVYKTINAEGDKIKVHNVNHQFELEDSIIDFISDTYIIDFIVFNKTNVDVVELKKPMTN
jgi:hypothetical protein